MDSNDGRRSGSEMERKRLNNMGILGGLFDDILELPEKVIDKTVKLPGKVVESVKEAEESLWDALFDD